MERKFLGFINRRPGCSNVFECQSSASSRMRINNLIKIVLWAALALPSKSQSCRYWCKSDDENSYYCCPSGKSEISFVSAMWPIMSSPIFWMGVIGTSIGIHAHGEPYRNMVITRMKKKLCPPMRSVCPRSFEWHEPPNFCERDDECDLMEKCCYDVCLEHKACKPGE